ncbi:MAG: STT3 domain-containing protein, partial [Myxococcota bacterium]|nr:STT3 domain-containing protein [Myxococcota bacterium]
MTPSRWLLNALALFGGALLVRALPAAHVLSQGIVFFRGPDSYYHMRRIVYAIQNFPEILVSDPYVQFPHNAQPIWPPLFDWVSAALLLPFAGGGNWLRVEQAAAWIPPILGAITAVATWSVGRRLFDDRAAFGAGALLCILGGHFTYSRVGALDHHVAVALVTTLLLGATLAALGRDSARRVLRSAAAVGVWIAVSLLIWPGSLLYAAISLIGLAGIALIASDAKQAALRWHALATASGCAALLIAPFCFGNEWLHYSSMSPLVLTDFQPWFLGTTAAVGLGTALLSERPALATRSLARAGVAVGIGTVLLGTSLLLSSDLIEGVGEAWRWLSKSEAFQASVIESQGLFFVNGRFTTFMAHL